LTTLVEASSVVQVTVAPEAVNDDDATEVITGSDDAMLWK
jgi:hypothetical protein